MVNHYLKDYPNIINNEQIDKPFTPESIAAGLPRWSNSASSSSMLLLIRDVMPGMRVLITDSKC